MTRKRRHRGPTPPRPWHPLQAATITPESEANRAAAAAAGVAAASDPIELWKNDRYTVSVDRDDADVVRIISIRRNDRKPARDWRDFQRIKDQLAGPDAEAVELYPAQARLVDTANQYWLWCLPAGVRFPLGFPDRVVTGELDDDQQALADEIAPNAVQRPPDGHGG